MSKKPNKKLISMRLKPDLLLQIDNARDLDHVSSRTQFVEIACNKLLEELVRV